MTKKEIADFLRCTVPSETLQNFDHGKKIFRWSDEKIDEVEKRMEMSFFDRFPEYAALEALLVPSGASDVKRALEFADRTRHILRELLSRIRTSRAHTRK